MKKQNKKEEIKVYEENPDTWFPDRMTWKQFNRDGIEQAKKEKDIFLKFISLNTSLWMGCGKIIMRKDFEKICKYVGITPQQFEEQLEIFKQRTNTKNDNITFDWYYDLDKTKIIEWKTKK